MTTPINCHSERERRISLAASLLKGRAGPQNESLPTNSFGYPRAGRVDTARCVVPALGSRR